MKKKSIDELFQERFREFEEAPDESVWKAIEASLDKKKSRKVIPIWWKLSGVAAVLAIFFFAINPFKNESSHPKIQVTETNKQNSTPIKEDLETPSIDVLKNNLDTLVEENSDAPETSDLPTQEKDSYVNTPNSDKTNKKELPNKQEKERFLFSKNKEVKKAVAHQEKTKDVKSTNNETSNTSSDNNAAIKNKAQRFFDVPMKKDNDNLAKNNSFSKGKDTLNSELQEKGFGHLEKQKEEGIAKKEIKKKSIFDEIKEPEKVVIQNSNSEKWSVGPSVAPVYFNGIGEGSPVHSIFVPNSKSGNINLSYGLAIAYEVSKKIKIRSGIHKVDYGYTTNEIAFSASLNTLETPQIANIAYANTAKDIVVTSRAFTSVSAENMAIETSADFAGKSAPLDGNLLQQFGYLEVPVEVNYALIDKRFGINLIGGISSLFLVNNAILLNSGDQTTQIGEANNINDLNFSTNFGVGVNYKFTSKLQFNIEPIFKYQLNTFSNTAGNFQPFSVGIYSGFSLQF